MSLDPQNPYQAGSSGGSPPYRRGTVEYGRMVSYVFENPNWFVNLLLMGVCNLIPVVGPLVLLGYQFEIVESLHRDPQRRYPHFDFGRFADYLLRGLWPFLVVLVASVVLMPIVLGGTFAVIFGFAMSLGRGGGPASAWLGVALVVFLVMIAVSLALQLVLLPLQLRAGLAQDFAAAFDFGFFKRFLANTWKECIVGMLFLVAIGLAATVVGLALCFVGILFTVGVVMLAQAHFHFQVYELYLDRGGEPIPLKPTKVPMPMPRPPL
jgi:hypothetical protein